MVSTNNYYSTFYHPTLWFIIIKEDFALKFLGKSALDGVAVLPKQFSSL